MVAKDMETWRKVLREAEAVALSMTMMIINLVLNLKKTLHEYLKTCKDFLTH
jgi:hypothetical protein